MADYTKDSYYQLSLNILKALGGDVSISYPDADAIWEEIYKIYDHAGGRFDIVPLQETITKNGTYDYYPESGADAYMPVNITVSIPQDYTDEDVAAIRREATIEGYNTGYVEGELSGKEAGFTEGYTSGFTAGETEGYSDGYAEGLDDGVEDQKALLEEIVITDNGVYEKEDGYNKVTVEVAGSTAKLGKLYIVESSNGNYTYDIESYGNGEDGWNEVELEIDVEQSGYTDEDMNEQYNNGYDQGYEAAMTERDEAMETIEITENGTYTSSAGFSEVVVEVAGGGDTGKPKIYNGFTLNYGSGKNAIAVSQLKNIDFSAYDWSNMNDLSYFFANFSGTFTNDDFESFDANFNGKMRVCAYMFNPTTGSNGTITFVPSFLSSKIKDCVLLDNLFYGQKLLTNVNELANWDTKNAISTSQMFYSCNKLTSVPLFDTSNVINMSNMFHTCEALTSVPLFDTSNVKNMTGMFQACYNMTSVPLFDTSNVINMRNMFYNCSKLTVIPQFDTRNVVDMAGMFQTCRELITIPELDTSKVVTMDSMFNTCLKLESLPLMDAGQLTNLNTFFGYSNITTLTYLGGFKDLGKQNLISGTESTYFLGKAPNLTKESVMNVINNLYDRAAVGLSIKTLKLHANHLAMLTDEEKAIATNKGWTVS